MNMPIEEDFRDAAERATKLQETLNDVLLQLCNLQTGNQRGCERDRPGFADFERVVRCLE